MKERYTTSRLNNDVWIYVVDSSTGNTVGKPFTLEENASYKCKQLNQDARHREMSEQIMQVAGVGGRGVNLCNEFNFIDLWEVVEWINTDDCDDTVTFDFYNWFDGSCLYTLPQYEMQTAIVEKIHELMKESKLIEVKS